MTTEGSTTTFAYDGLGRRVRKTPASGYPEIYLYDGDNLVVQVNYAMQPIREYSYYPGVDQPHAVRNSGTGDVPYYLSGTTRSVAALVHGSNQVLQRYEYLPFSARRSATGSVERPFQFTAREFNGETGLYYYRARYYEPAIARFISEDPIGLAGGVNPYAYAGNDPVNATDPSGTCTITYHWSMWSDGTDFTIDAVTSEGCEGGGGGSVPSNPSTPKPTKPQSKVCRALPSGRTTGATGGVGGIGSVGGGGEIVMNYNSGQTSAFPLGGTQIGWNGGMTGSVYTGFVYGLNDANSNYSGGFTGFNVGAGPGIFAASSSGGLTGGTSKMAPNGEVTAYGVSLGAGLLSGFSGGVTATNYSSAQPIGKFGAFTTLDLLLFAARQTLCK